MRVSRIYISTHKYDFMLAKICIASIRYWYPDIPIFLIKDFGSGFFNTTATENLWNVGIFNTERKRFGWGFGKLEPLFLHIPESFLVLDADTVLTGLVLDAVFNIDAHFIVDEEVQPEARFNEIYYNLDRISELEPGFKYPGYSFNSGQWFGTSNIISRSDFDKSLEWSEPPKPRCPEIVFNGDQAQLNFVLHLKEKLGQISVQRIKLMIWPSAGAVDIIDVSSIIKKKDDYPYVIHWAGIRSRTIKSLPRADILQFYQNFYYSKLNSWQRFWGECIDFYYTYEKTVKVVFQKILQKLKTN